MRRAAAFLGCLVAVARPAVGQSALDHYQVARGPAWQVDLPDALVEVSGLAVDARGRLYAHGDEQATVFRFDSSLRRVAGRFALTGLAGVLAGDFEDIAIVGERLFLVTSAGVIWESRPAEDGRLVEAVRRTRGVGNACEVEGLDYDPPTQALLLLCKRVHAKRWTGRVVILAVSLPSWRFEDEPRMVIREKDLEHVTGSRHFSGSALTRHPGTGTYLLIAGPERVIAEVDREGRVLGGASLDKRRHRQPEGLAIAPDGTLLVSDEAAGKRATLTAYAWHP